MGLANSHKFFLDEVKLVKTIAIALQVYISFLQTNELEFYDIFTLLDSDKSIERHKGIISDLN